MIIAHTITIGTALYGLFTGSPALVFLGAASWGIVRGVQKVTGFLNGLKGEDK